MPQIYYKLNTILFTLDSLIARHYSEGHFSDCALRCHRVKFRRTDGHISTA